MREAVTSMFTVVGAGLRLWVRHWPVLLAIALFGAGARMGAIWAATVLSNHNNTLGVMVLVLAPLSYVTAIILMLYSLRGSLPHIASAAATTAPDDPLRHRERRLIDMLASVLVPFLAVYASYGFLREDVERFINAAVADEFLNNDQLLINPADAIDTDRFVFATGWLAVAIVLVAFVFRFGLAKIEGWRALIGVSFAGAYVEVLWLSTLAAQFTLYKDDVWDWVESRRAVDIFVDGWEGLLDRLGSAADPVDATVDWIFGILGNFDAIVIVPVAWLTVGAVVYGHKLVPPEPPPRAEHPALARIPRPVRRWTRELFADIRERFAALFGGLRQLAVAGLGPMLTFGLAFLVSARIQDLLDLGARAAIGPQEVDTWLAFSPHVNTVTSAIGLTLTMCLLAAAVDRVLEATSRLPPPPTEDDPDLDDPLPGDPQPGESESSSAR